MKYWMFAALNISVIAADGKAIRESIPLEITTCVHLSSIMDKATFSVMPVEWDVLHTFQFQLHAPPHQIIASLKIFPLT